MTPIVINEIEYLHEYISVDSHPVPIDVRTTGIIVHFTVVGATTEIIGKKTFDGIDYDPSMTREDALNAIKSDLKQIVEGLK
ncbi:hypothetical protein ACFFJY_09105 [Fictibacillus aquaticus]|uniref:Uncharacterized protein n=1 Tax=Fictibacillus aquaticus TaxID=2021314 RepID=A0A235FAT4_9BACL|nr:hypothetical protein [Fictibacillus aquaticus]OYD58440.1 hypothetical protein CGZ90_00625 [Fictibacillus aquaticus]